MIGCCISQDSAELLTVKWARERAVIMECLIIFPFSHHFLCCLLCRWFICEIGRIEDKPAQRVFADHGVDNMSLTSGNVTMVTFLCVHLMTFVFLFQDSLIRLPPFACAAMLPWLYYSVYSSILAIHR